MTTRYSFQLLRAAKFKLDGGSMFGLIPRVVWARALGDAVDERGRIPVQHNCLLLERSGAAEPASAGAEGGEHACAGPQACHPKLVVIETGTGNKLDAKSRDIFGLEDRWLGDALHEVDCRAEDVEAVAVTHLHFDHAGGLTRLCRPGETADWTGPASTMAGSRPDHGVKVTFPNAAVYAQAREWDDALANRSVMTRTYFPDHLLPIRERVRLVDSPRPFPTGYTPDRGEMPRLEQGARETEILPGIFVFLAPGHTWGQQAIRFTDVKGRDIVFTPDVMPTAWHLGAAYSLGYDVEPYTSMISRGWYLAEAAARGWVLCLDHEPGWPLFRVRANEKGWFDLVREEM
jgi:glyoxylase-like metal-dependent hydrolase (beta-lactamase superfamily II)